MSEHTSEKAQTNAEKNLTESAEDVSTLNEKNEVSNDREIEIEDMVLCQDLVQVKMRNLSSF